MAISSIPSDIFRKAEETDIERIWQIIGQAKAQMQRLGSQQWDENYPAIEHIRQDIQDGNGYVICREDRVVAYGVISFDGEPVYKDIEGKWSNDLPYVIVHRLAIADEMKRQGMAKQFMLQAEEVSRKKGVYNFRVDTKYDNAYMLRLIDTLGFKYCGEVYYRNNSARKAFEKTIRPYSHPIGISDYTIREATFEDAREEITKDMYEEYCNKFDDIVFNKDFKTSAIKRKLKELIEEINHYYGDDSTVPKDIFDLVQEINEKIKELEYTSEDYYI